MNDDIPAPLPGSGPQPVGGNTYQQELQHSPATARVPDAVGRGVFGTGAIVMHGAHEFLIDFIQSLAAPRRVVARVILPPTVMPLLVGALEDNLGKYAHSFGPPPRMPVPVAPGTAHAGGVQGGSGGTAHGGAAGGAAGGAQGGAAASGAGGQPPAPPPAPPPPPPITDVYEQLKLPDEMLGGVYANTVVISHSPAEFCFDFIGSFYPRSVVTCRVYLSTPHVTELYDSLKRSLEQYRQKLMQARTGPPPPLAHEP